MTYALKDTAKLIVICCFSIFMVACGGGTSTNNSNATTSTSGVDVSAATTNENGVVTLSWYPPTENTDGSTITNLNGYKIYYGTSPDALASSVTVNSVGLTSYVLDRLVAGTVYYFAITAYTNENVESDYSNVTNKLANG
ncbi:MAG: fibronectin type III domain-containing protein [Gammaproteobacteria bacterium]|nr:fibronectin type III domain-containing protein [Gammaproteobacteria bacterium]